MKYPIYKNTVGDVKINIPDSLMEEERLSFTLIEEEEKPASVTGYSDGEWIHFEQDGDTFLGPEVKAPVLIYAVKDQLLEVDGIIYSISQGFAYYYSVSKLDNQSVELKNVLEVGGVYYPITNYGGCFNQCDNITSLTFPGSSMSFDNNSMNIQSGLREIHLKALDPILYNNIENAFGQKDLSEVVLYVPKGSLEVYKQSVFANLFVNILEEELS